MNLAYDLPKQYPMRHSFGVCTRLYTRKLEQFLTSMSNESAQLLLPRLMHMVLFTTPAATDGNVSESRWVYIWDNTKLITNAGQAGGESMTK